MKNRKLLIPVRFTTRKFYLQLPGLGRRREEVQLGHGAGVIGGAETNDHLPDRYSERAWQSLADASLLLFTTGMTNALVIDS